MKKQESRTFAIAFQKPAFRDAALAVVASIPAGQTLSYGEVALRAGYPGAARAVGTLMSRNRDPLIPCHRVVRSDGTVGEYAFGGTKQKIARLKKEGVSIDHDGRVLK